MVTIKPTRLGAKLNEMVVILQIYLRLKVMLQLIEVTRGAEIGRTNGISRQRTIKALDARRTTTKQSAAHRIGCSLFVQHK